MDKFNLILMNMYDQGSIISKGDENMSAYVNTNERNIVIELERKNNTNNLWNNNLSNRYISYIRFKDIFTNRYLLELTIYDINEVKLLFDMIDEWYSFNCSYEMVYPLNNNNYHNGISHSIHLSRENVKQIINNDGNIDYIQKFYMYIDQYDKNTNTNIRRLTINMGEDDTCIQDFIDTAFFILLVDIPEIEDEYIDKTFLL